MSANWYSATFVFDGVQLHENHAICVEDGVVCEMRATGSLPAEVSPEHHDGILAPGFFDIQVNGGGGVLLNTDPSFEGIATICEAHRELGTTALLPTVITDRPEVTEAAGAACLAALDLPGMVGVHIEGPHISKRRRGTHSADFIRDMDARTLALVQDLRGRDLPVLMTVAPETTNAGQVAQLVEMGAVVSIGHSDASSLEVAGLLEAGATGFTHLYNAMSPMQGRAPGVVGAGISSDAWCSVIADGIHVDPLMIALAFRARPQEDRMIVISDAMPTVGGPERFVLYGNEIRLKEGRLVNGEGALAGAHLSTLEAVRNLVSYGIPLVDALRAARHNPAQFMGLWSEMGLLGARAGDILRLTGDLDLCAVGLGDLA